MLSTSINEPPPPSPLELLPLETARRILFFTPPAALAALLHASKTIRRLFNQFKTDDRGRLTDADSDFAYDHLQFHHGTTCVDCGRACPFNLQSVRDKVPFSELPIHYALMVLNQYDFSFEAIEAVTNGDYSVTLRRVEP
ncbi:hypothetical protein HDU96_010978 [Phlyctochytrium bullatum]|nr:hypothetical protein HDU96_010978 [Phlyctochytrium bullatum]